eukprot:352122-Chlamydomonas_euryale.AAC.12
MPLAPLVPCGIGLCSASGAMRYLRHSTLQCLGRYALPSALDFVMPLVQDNPCYVGLRNASGVLPSPESCAPA